MNSKVISNISLNYSEIESEETKVIPKVEDNTYFPPSKENTKEQSL